MVRAILLHAYPAKFSPLQGRERLEGGSFPPPRGGEQNRNQVRDNMGKYLLKRILHGVVSIMVVVIIVMVLIYSLLNREQVFSADSAYGRQGGNTRETYC